MYRCPKCNKSFDENYTFCEECGVRLINEKVQTSARSKPIIFDRIERSLFFRITRSYTWVILVLAMLGFIGAIIYLIPDISLLIKKDTNVSAEEIKMTITAKKTGKSPSEEEISSKRINPELLAKLDKEIYELIALLPKKVQDEAGLERGRGVIKNTLGRYQSMKEKTKVLREIKNILMKFDESERVEALNTFFNIKAGKENAIATRQAEISLRLATIGGTFFALIMTIAAFSLILVLLAIERNTRRG